MIELMKRTPQVIATEIYSIKGQARQVILYSSSEIGKRLVEAKAMLPHGEWGDWLKNSVEYSQSTANNLMQIYREYGTDMDRFPTLGNLSYTKALALIGVPEEDREQFVKDNDIESMSARELQQAIKDKQELEKRLKKSEAAAEKDRLAQQKITDSYAGLELKIKANDDLIDRLNADLEEARASGNNDVVSELQESLEQSKTDLADSLAKIKELEKQLKQKPIDVSAVVEKIPEAVEAELAELRKQVNQQSDKAVIKFTLCFEALVKGFQDVLGALGGIKEEEAQEKYRVAVKGLIEKMKERL